MKNIRIFLLFSLALSLPSCVREIADADPGGIPATIRIEPSAYLTPDGIETKSSLTMTNIERALKSITMGFYDADTGDLVMTRYGSLSATNAAAWSMEIAPGTYNIYVFANMGDLRSSLPDNDTRIGQVEYTIPSFSGMDSTGLPMAGKLLDTELTYSANTATVPLERLVAKVNLTVDFSGLNYSHISYNYFTPECFSVKQMNRLLKPFASDGSFAGTDPDNVCDGDEEDSSGWTWTDSNEQVLTGYVYVPENRAGTLLPSNTDSYSKDVAGLKAAGVAENVISSLTYIQLDLSGINGSAQGKSLDFDAAYRFYIGKDNVTDFDIVRNTLYDITLGFDIDNLFPGLEWKLTHENEADRGLIYFGGSTASAAHPRSITLSTSQTTATYIYVYSDTHTTGTTGSLTARGGQWEEFEVLSGDHGFTKMLSDGYITYNSKYNSTTHSYTYYYLISAANAKNAAAAYFGQTFKLGVKLKDSWMSSARDTLNVYFTADVGYNASALDEVYQGQEVTLEVTGLPSGSAATFTKKSGTATLTAVTTAAEATTRSCKVKSNQAGDVVVTVTCGSVTQDFTITFRPVYLEITSPSSIYYLPDGTNGHTSYLPGTSSPYWTDHVISFCYYNANNEILPASTFAYNSFKTLSFYPNSYVTATATGETNSYGYPTYKTKLTETPVSELPSTAQGWAGQYNKYAKKLSTSLGCYGGAQLRGRSDYAYSFNLWVVNPLRRYSTHTGEAVTETDMLPSSIDGVACTPFTCSGSRAADDVTDLKDAIKISGNTAAISWYNRTGNAFQETVFGDDDGNLLVDGLSGYAFEEVIERHSGAGGGILTLSQTGLYTTTYMGTAKGYMPAANGLSGDYSGESTVKLVVTNANSGTEYRVTFATFRRREAVGLVPKGFSPNTSGSDFFAHGSNLGYGASSVSSALWSRFNTLISPWWTGPDEFSSNPIPTCNTKNYFSYLWFNFGLALYAESSLPSGFASRFSQSVQSPWYTSGTWNPLPVYYPTDEWEGGPFLLHNMLYDLGWHITYPRGLWNYGTLEITKNSRANVIVSKPLEKGSDLHDAGSVTTTLGNPVLGLSYAYFHKYTEDGEFWDSLLYEALEGTYRLASPSGYGTLSSGMFNYVGGMLLGILPESFTYDGLDYLGMSDFHSDWVFPVTVSSRYPGSWSETYYDVYILVGNETSTIWR